MSRHRDQKKTEPASTVLYATSIQALTSLLTPIPFSPHLLTPPKPPIPSLPPQPAKIKDTSLLNPTSFSPTLLTPLLSKFPLNASDGWMVCCLYGARSATISLREKLHFDAPIGAHAVVRFVN